MPHQLEYLCQSPQFVAHHNKTATIKHTELIPQKR